MRSPDRLHENEPETVTRFKKFMRSSEFPCSYGLDALEAGEIAFAQLPESDNVMDRQDVMWRAMDDFADDFSSVSACVFTEPKPFEDLERQPAIGTAYTLTWSTYAALRVACDRFNAHKRLLIPDVPALVDDACATASRFTDPSTVNEFMLRGMPNIAGQQLFFFAIGPHFEDRPGPHMRYASTPEQAYFTIRISTVDKAKAENPGPAIAMLREGIARSARLFNASVPFPVPGHPQFDAPLFSSVLKWVEQKVAADLLTGDPLAISRSIILGYLDEEDRDALLNRLAQAEYVSSGTEQLLDIPVVNILHY